MIKLLGLDARVQIAYYRICQSLGLVERAQGAYILARSQAREAAGIAYAWCTSRCSAIVSPSACPAPALILDDHDLHFWFRSSVEDAYMACLREQERHRRADNTELVEQSIADGNWPALNLPDPRTTLVMLLLGESVTIVDHRLQHIQGDIWFSNPYGKTGILSGESLYYAVEHFTADMARGIEYGSSHSKTLTASKHKTAGTEHHGQRAAGVAQMSRCIF